MSYFFYGDILTEEIIEEMKTQNSLTDILNKKVKYAVREVTTFLDYDSAMQVFEVRDKVEVLENQLKLATESKEVRSIADTSVQEIQDELDFANEELKEIMEATMDSKVVWTVTGVPPRVWRIIDSKARQKFPLSSSADEYTKTEVNLKRNEFVNIETIRVGIKKVVFASGEVFENISHEDATFFWNELPIEAIQPVKEKIDELTFANQGFQEALSSADFL